MKRIIFILIIIIVICYFQYGYINKINNSYEILQSENPKKGIFENLSASISGFFGTTTMEDLKNFSNMELNSQNAKLNAETISEVAKAMSDMSKFKFTGDGITDQTSFTDGAGSPSGTNNANADEFTFTILWK